jgi:hypothetical protein
MKNMTAEVFSSSESPVELAAKPTANDDEGVLPEVLSTALAVAEIVGQTDAATLAIAYLCSS